MYRENLIERVNKNQRWIGVAFLLDLLDGLTLTLSYLFSRSITMQYPDKEKWIPYPRFRGHHFLNKDEKGENRCVACELCSRICPCQCIKVVPYEDEKGNRRPQIYDVDTARCLFCGLCEDACPVGAIALGQRFEFSTYDSKKLLKGKDELLQPEVLGKTTEGGKVVKASCLSDVREVKVELRDTKGYHWWKRIRRR